MQACWRSLAFFSRSWSFLLSRCAHSASARMPTRSVGDTRPRGVAVLPVSFSNTARTSSGSLAGGRQGREQPSAGISDDDAIEEEPVRKSHRGLEADRNSKGLISHNARLSDIGPTGLSPAR